MRLFFLLILLLLFCVPAHAQDDMLLRYPQSSFDSDTCCWRKLAAGNHYEQAADLVVAYLKGGRVQNAHALQWHAGQLYAASGARHSAIKYFSMTYNIFYRWFGDKDAKAWYFYARGCTAFVKRKRSRLHKYISLWERKLPKDINYKQLVLLSEHWDKSGNYTILHAKDKID